MKKQHYTNRLLLDELKLSDADFILELVNTDGWLQFIGDRNIKSKEDAIPYIQKILDNQKVKYWVVRSKEDDVAVGVITFIKRDYLNHSDIGFAFLPQYAGKGYAYEATLIVLKDAVKEHTHILATTVKDNKRSIQLLEKLGFKFEKEIHNDQTNLLLYGITADKVKIDELIKTFFRVFNNATVQPDWQIIYDLCIPETIIIKKQKDTEVVYDLNSFIEPRKQLLLNGTLTDFEEHELSEDTKIIGGIAQRFTRYQKSGTLNGQYFKEDGSKFFQFIKTAAGWKINSLIWEDDSSQ